MNLTEGVPLCNACNTAIANETLDGEVLCRHCFSVAIACIPPQSFNVALSEALDI